MSESNCKNLATVRRFWPGSPPDMVCVEHAQDSQRIASAMGFYVHLEPVGYSTDELTTIALPTCCCSAGFSQTVEVQG